MPIGIVIAVVAVLVIAAAVISHFVTVSNLKKNAESKIGNAESKAREIIDDAVKTAEAKKKESLLEIKEESIKNKNELEKETKERRAELQRYEKRVLSKEETLDKKADAIEKREAGFAAKEEQLRQREVKVDELSKQRVQELERISGLTSEQAKEYLLKTVEEDVKHDTAKLVKELEVQAKEEADKKAREYVVTAIQRCAADHVAETTISVVQLPSDEMKGRIIGREGRNIRTLETMTGVELIIDDTPEAVVLSGFDPIRREVARIALEKLIVDGRIHPARIEEMVEKAQKEVESMIREEGEAAALEVGVHGIHPELIKLLGRMKFRTSYGQNALKHSMEVSQLAGLLAGEIGLDVRVAKRAGLLHDIGKSIDHDVEGSHIQIGVDLCRKYKESGTVINAVEAHHGDVEPQTLIACVVQAADTISAARPGARRETLETYTNRLKQLEDITNQFKGVDKSFAI
ncbi:ribonuclease Y, partial [Turicimonas muris]|uniref:ribonuclease Y n=1 Tax=Turicimonas muris TaxID=1796652 RepID=UPI0032202964